MVFKLPDKVHIRSRSHRIRKRILLLGICRQIRAEASPIFYGENEFHASFALGSRDDPML